MSTVDGARESHPLVDYLNRLVERDDRGALAALRRGLGKEPGTAPEMYPHVMRFNPSAYDERSYFLVASLFALWHQGSPPRGGPTPRNFGDSFRQVAQQSQSESIDRRFVALLNADRDELPDHLRHAVSLMRSAGQPVRVNWDQLLRDLRYWDSERRTVQRAWARGFWGRTDQSDDAPNNENA